MRRLFILIGICISVSGFGQLSRDTVLSRCPVYITDTVTANNFFIEARPATLKVYRVRGDLTIVFEQRDQFFSMFFHEKRLRNTTYDIQPGSKGRGEVEVAYSFKSGDQVAFINVADGTLQSTYDKATRLWKIKVNGTITSMSDRSLSYYRVRTEFTVK